MFPGDIVDNVLEDMDFSDDLNSRYLRLVQVKIKTFLASMLKQLKAYIYTNI